MRLIAIALLAVSAFAADFPAPASDLPKPPQKAMQTAVFAGGCFWCTEAVFEKVAGVTKVVSGYSGGSKADADYKKVSEGRTQHAEAIEITFDASKITYGQLLRVFFSVAHDPTQVDRQGPDWGKQYRSAIFTANADQERVTKAYINQLTEAKVFNAPIATQVAPLTAFYAAEGYHQDFVKLNPDHRYVVVNAIPKLRKLEKAYPDLVKK